MASDTHTNRFHTCRRLALAGLVAFLVCLAVEHVLEPSLDPARHQISEYVNTSSGAIMVVGFLAWAGSIVATAICVWDGWGARLLSLTMGLASLGMITVACFATQTSAGALPPSTTLTATGRLHDIGSGLSSLALLASAVLSVAERGAPRAFRRRTVALIVVAAAGSGALLVIGPSVGGARQRLVVLVGCLWQWLLLRALSCRGRTKGPQGSRRCTDLPA